MHPVTESANPKLTRAEQNRINAQKSTGPRTEEGKQRSSFNALKHGIYSHQVVLDNESPEEFMKLLRAYRDQFQPTDQLEADLIQDLADARWRIMRMKQQEAIEWNQANFDASHDPRLDEAPNEILIGFGHRRSCKTKGNPLETCRRAEARYRRDFDRALKTLTEHRRQKSRNEATPHPVTDPAPPPDPPPAQEKSQNEAIPPTPPPPMEPPSDLTPQSADEIDALMHYLGRSLRR